MTKLCIFDLDGTVLDTVETIAYYGNYALEQNGIAPIPVEQIFELIKELHDAGTTILLVEQNASKALEISDRAYVLETGSVILSGAGQELAQSDEVRKAYLGG